MLQQNVFPQFCSSVAKTFFKIFSLRFGQKEFGGRASHIVVIRGRRPLKKID